MIARHSPDTLITHTLCHHRSSLEYCGALLAMRFVFFGVFFMFDPLLTDSQIPPTHSHTHTGRGGSQCLHLHRRQGRTKVRGGKGRARTRTETPHAPRQCCCPCGCPAPIKWETFVLRAERCCHEAVSLGGRFCLSLIIMCVVRCVCVCAQMTHPACNSRTVAVKSISRCRCSIRNISEDDQCLSGLIPMLWSFVVFWGRSLHPACQLSYLF